jgi:hypothetical protein
MANMNMDIRNLFSQVINVIDELNLDPALRPIAFEMGVELLAKSGGAGRSSQGDGNNASNGGADFGDDPKLAMIARKLEVTDEEVDRVFHDSDGELGIGIAASKLPKAMSAAMKDIALLVAAARQAGGYDLSWTKTSEIRRICIDFGKFDTANFASTITEMGGVFNFRGKGQSREIKVLRPGFEAAGTLVKRYAGTIS